MNEPHRPADLTSLFWPVSIAVIGASPRTGSIGGSVITTLVGCGFSGHVFPVNPNHSEVLGLPAYPRVADVSHPLDLAIVVVPAAKVAGVVEECASAGVASVIVLSSNFGEGQNTGTAYNLALQNVLAKRQIRVSGPNAEGILNTRGAIAATFSPAVDPDRGGTTLTTGDVAIVAQSGGLAFGFFADGVSRGLGFSFVVTTGNETDLGMLDYVEYLLEDPETSVIALYIEGLQRVSDLTEMASRARHAGKHLVVAKVGSSAPGRRAAFAHTAHLAGDDDAFDATLRSLGIPRATDQEDLIDVTFALARCRNACGERVGVITLSGGAGVWMADALESQGLHVPELSAATQDRLRKLVPEYGAVSNPVDATAQVLNGDGGLTEVIGVVLGSGEVDLAVIVVTLASSEFLERERAQLKTLLDAVDIPVLVYTYSGVSRESVELLTDLKLPWYPSSSRAARACRVLVDISTQATDRAAERSSYPRRMSRSALKVADSQ